jgi:hypothetical protein
MQIFLNQPTLGCSLFSPIGMKSPRIPFDPKKTSWKMIYILATAVDSMFTSQGLFPSYRSAWWVVSIIYVFNNIINI